MERTSPSTKPVKTFRLRGITASVFRNVTESNGHNVPYYKWTIQRTYKDGDDSFRNTTSFTRDDWPIVQLLGQKAWEFILEAEAEEKNGKE